MDNTRVCSRCTTRSRSSSIHKTLAYARCRCHRLFEKKHDSMAKVSTALHIPEPISSLHGQLRSDLSTFSQSISTASHLSPSMPSVIQSPIAIKSDRQTSLPSICEQQSLVADFSTSVVVSDYSNGYSNLGAQATKTTQKMNSQSLTALEKLSLPKLLPLSR